MGSGGSYIWCDGLEIARAIAAKHHASGRDILDRKAKCVKFDRTIVVTCKLTNGKKVLN